MKWLSRLELKYGRYAIRNLTQYLIGINIAVYVIVFVTLDPSFLFLIPNEVLRGQVWRLVSFIFLPETTNPIWVFLQLYLLYFIGTAIEGVWGRFKYNLFYFCGMIITIIAAFISGLGVTGLYLNLSLFLAFATLFAEQELLFFFVLPIKVKFLPSGGGLCTLPVCYGRSHRRLVYCGGHRCILCKLPAVLRWRHHKMAADEKAGLYEPQALL